ncbi:hypothetical protein GF323_05505 [Candidatus Woesearchaeota archaeon]|nr:hypothetical protein [Candidatus Woesearchaeota archaeon]
MPHGIVIIMNPFRLSGSYIGLGIGIITGFFVYSAFSVLCEFFGCNILAYVFPFLIPVIGLLAGFGLHMLSVRIRKPT